MSRWKEWLILNKVHVKTILSWHNTLANKLTYVENRNIVFQLIQILETKKTTSCFMSIVVLSCLVYVGIIRANNICQCAHTHTQTHTSLYLAIYIYTLVWLHLMCPNGLDSNLFTHNLFLFQSDLGVWMSRDQWTIEMRKQQH